MLGIAARRATIVGVAPSIATAAFWGDARVQPAAAADAQLARVRQAAGDRFDRLELSMVTTAFVVTDRRDEVVASIASHLDFPPEAVLESPYHLIGTVDQIVEALEVRRERWGVSYWTIPVASIDDAAPVVARLAGT
jgi:hypothetical protein